MKEYPIVTRQTDMPVHQYLTDNFGRFSKQERYTTDLGQDAHTPYKTTRRVIPCLIFNPLITSEVSYTLCLAPK